MVGDVYRLYLPDIGRQRAGGGRLRGLRLIRSHLEGEPLNRDDLADLSKLRLDAIVNIEVGMGGYPGAVHWAHLTPNVQESAPPWLTFQADAPSQLEVSWTDFITELEGEYKRKVDTLVTTDSDAALLVYVSLPDGRSTKDTIEELRELARTAGIGIRDVVIQNRTQPDPKYLVGRGKLEDIVLRALQLDVELLIFGNDLAPRQMRALTDSSDLRIIDRTQLILDIFAQHASSADGKLQVELAQLKYALPRLVSKNTGMSRLTGGIGGRGPGETKLEINRRRARDRIRNLEKNIERLSRQREQRRERRNSSGLPIVSIVGYTNAGKSTLLNSLTNSSVLSEDKLFATLVPTTRKLRFPDERQVILTDTVGFIHDLPRDLVAAFKATLEELEESNLLIHLVDISTPGFEARMRAVQQILDELGLGDKPQLLVFNKMDLADPIEVNALARTHKAIPCSALDKSTMHPLVDELERKLFFNERGTFAERVDQVLQEQVG
ncbi:MAG: GTPase HflX [Myxococcota bacterium]